MSKENRFMAMLAIVCGAFFITLLLYYAGAFKKIEYISYDTAVRSARLSKSAPPEVVVVLIDEASLQALNPVVGRWPWPRALFADFLEFVMMGEPRAVLFDILNTETFVARGKDGGLGKDDTALVRATRESGVVVHAMQLIRDTEDEKNKTLTNRPLPEDFVSRFALKNATGTPAGAGLNNNYYIPFPELYSVASKMAVVEFAPDDDGVYRRTRPLREYRGSLFPVLGMAPALDVNTPITVGAQSIVIGAKTIPLDAQGHYTINMYGKINTYSISGIFASLQKIRSGDVENLMVDPSEFKDKIVFLGGSAVGVEDMKPTPMSSLTPGVFLHASLAGNFLTGDFPVPPAPVHTVAAMALFAALAAAGIFYIRIFGLKALLPVALAGGWIALGLWGAAHNRLFEFVPPVAALLFASLSSFGYQALTEGREKAKVRQMFSQYVSPEVLDLMSENAGQFATLGGGSKVDITVLFSDIRGFTTFSDKTPPEQVVMMLNTHFSHMTEAIFHTRGTVDKYIGDAIMAFWGAPVPLPDHPDRAVLAAMEMTRKLKTVNAELKEKGIELDLHIGIGVNSGEAIIGSIGSRRKLNYTVIGDTVNLASRLESLNKNYGAPVIISEFTRRRLTDPKIVCRILDRVMVRGKAEPVRIYEAMVYDEGDGFEKARAACDAVNRAFDLYEKGDYKSALKLYNETENETLRALFIKRCELAMGEAEGR